MTKAMDNGLNKTGTAFPARLLEGGLELHDDFTDDRAAGSVIGSLTASGHERLGVDVEGVMSIDHGALRITHLVEAGFGRAAIAYGPFERAPGLAFAVYMLNGHNTAQDENLPTVFGARIKVWLRGSETEPMWKRVASWIRQPRFKSTVRKMKWWRRTAVGRPVAALDENLAVGWFPAADTPDPRAQGSGFIMHALGPENGELWAGGVSVRTRSLRGVQNLPLYFVAITRVSGTVYYVSSLEGALGLVPYPWLRPVAVDHSPVGDEVYMGIHQGVLGQIGFRLDTRVQGVRVAHLGGHESWCAGAHAADRLAGRAPRGDDPADIGGKWQILPERAAKGVEGVTDPAAGTIAVLDPGSPSGLIHALVTPGDSPLTSIGLVWRCVDASNHWRLELGKQACTLVLMTEGGRHVVASRELPAPGDTEARRLQILDDGSHLMAYIDGEPLADAWFSDVRLNNATRVGIFSGAANQNNGIISRFEAHPRQIKLPEAFDMGAPWLRKGSQVVVADDFAGARGDLEGRQTTVGGMKWNRLMGKGFIDITGQGAALVRASARAPCPGRTAYCFDWSRPDFADAEVTITPSGTRVGENERTMSGLIMYQDPRNFIIVNAYRTDAYPGGSVSTFFKFGSFEDVFDAVWTNVGYRIRCGKSVRLRVSCDGERYIAFIDDEPVLYRAFRDVYPDVDRLRLRKVGIVSNWEFGNDTGSKFEHFKLRI